MLSGADNSIRNLDVPDSCVSGGHDGVSRNTPGSGTKPVTMSTGDLVVEDETPTASQKGLARTNVFRSRGQIDDDDDMETPVVISIPDTSSDEGVVSDDGMVTTKGDIDRSPQRYTEDDDYWIPSTPSSGRRRRNIGMTTKNISGKNLDILFHNDSMIDWPGDNDNGVVSDNEEGTIDDNISQPPSDDFNNEGGPGNGDQPIRLEAGAGIRVGVHTYEKRGCQYRGDHCTIHGGGAVMRFRGGSKLVRGRSGKLVKRYQRGESNYVCDLARGGRGGKLVQTTLSFRKTTGSELNNSARILEVSISEGQGSDSTNHGVITDEKGTASR